MPPRPEHDGTLVRNQALIEILTWCYFSLVSGHTKTPARPLWGLAGVCRLSGHAQLSRPPVWLLALAEIVATGGAQRHAALQLCEHSFSHSLAPVASSRQVLR